MVGVVRIFGLFVFVLALPRAAEACTPFIHQDYVLPAQGAVHPVNAVVFARGEGALWNAQAAVAGVPTANEHVLAWGGWVGGGGSEAACLVDTPEQGAQVNWTWDPMCFECAPLSYAIGPPDVTPPAPPLALAFDVHDFPEFYDNSCVTTDLTYWFHVQGPPQDEGSPVMLVLEGRPVGHDGSTLKWIGRTEPGPITVGEPMLTWNLDGVPPAEAYCFTLYTRDLAGNASTVGLEVCSPCHLSTTPAGVDDPWSVKEPAWSDADLFPGGQCEGASIDVDPGDPAAWGCEVNSDGTSTTGDTGGTGDGAGTSTGEDVTTTGASTGEVGPATAGEAGGPESPKPDGCGCAATGAGAPWGLAVVLLGLRRRRAGLRGR